MKHQASKVYMCHTNYSWEEKSCTFLLKIKFCLCICLYVWNVFRFGMRQVYSLERTTVKCEMMMMMMMMVAVMKRLGDLEKSEGEFLNVNSALLLHPLSTTMLIVAFFFPLPLSPQLSISSAISLLNFAAILFADSTPFQLVWYVWISNLTWHTPLPYHYHLAHYSLVCVSSWYHFFDFSTCQYYYITNFIDLLIANN